MAALPSLVPEGASDDIDLSTLTPDQLQAHHVKGLRLAGVLDGAHGQAAYRRQYPAAAHLRGNVTALAYAPKPKGYDAAITATVTQWFNSKIALAATNRADVGRLNVRLETTRFNPANHFSKPLSPSLLEKVATVCSSHGIVLQTRPGMTLGQVRQSIRAARLSGAAAAQPFGNVGTRTGNTVTIGGRSFTVGKHGDRECISVTAEGVTQRVSLASVAAICAGLLDGTGAGKSSDYPLRSRTGELCPGTIEADSAGPAPNWRALPGDTSPAADPLYGRTLPAADPIDPEPLSLSDKIRRLAAALPVIAPAVTPGADPLELDPLEL